VLLAILKEGQWVDPVIAQQRLQRQARIAIVVIFAVVAVFAVTAKFGVLKEPTATGQTFEQKMQTELARRDTAGR
jgi:hypothetical protein